MRKNVSHQNTDLLIDWSKGDEFTLEQLMPLVYDELRLMARYYMHQQPSGHTFQATALIHEAYLKLAVGKDRHWQNCDHFFGVMAKTMCHILVDCARSESSMKHGGGQKKITLDKEPVISAEYSNDVVALHEALNHLSVLDERRSRIVEMKFFTGLKIVEIAGALKISPKTAKRDLQFAKSWLLHELAKTNHRKIEVKR